MCCPSPHALFSLNSPLVKTTHKAGNGELTITCRNRHCPKCQAPARAKWLQQRQAELLPVEYFHVVFTLPAAIADIAYHNKAVIYDLLFKASAEAMPLPDASFDVVLCQMGLQFVPDKHAALREMRRVSRKWLVIDYRHRYSLRYWMWKLKMNGRT